MKTMKKVIPVGRRILVRKDSVEKQSAGGIWYAGESVERAELMQAYGTVVAIADEAFIDVYKRKQCGEGDRIIFRSGAGVGVDDTDKDLILLNDSEVLAIIIEEESDGG